MVEVGCAVAMACRLLLLVAALEVLMLDYTKARQETIHQSGISAERLARGRNRGPAKSSPHGQGSLAQRREDLAVLCLPAAGV